MRKVEEGLRGKWGMIDPMGVKTLPSHSKKGFASRA